MILMLLNFFIDQLPRFYSVVSHWFKHILLVPVHVQFLPLQGLINMELYIVIAVFNYI